MRVSLKIPRRAIESSLTNRRDKARLAESLERLNGDYPPEQFCRLGLDLIGKVDSTSSELAIATRWLETLEGHPEGKASARLAFAMADAGRLGGIARLDLFEAALEQPLVETPSQAARATLGLLSELTLDQATATLPGALAVLRSDYFKEDRELLQLSSRPELDRVVQKLEQLTQQASARESVETLVEGQDATTLFERHVDRIEVGDLSVPVQES